MGQRRPRRRRAHQSSRSFPALAAAVGVIVVGFGIGAVFAAFSHRAPSSQQSEFPTPSHSMISRVTPVPMIPARALIPLHTPHASSSPRASATPQHSPAASASPQASSEASPPPSAVVATRTPAPPASAKPSPNAASPVPAVSLDTDTPVTRSASALVRRYIAAVMRGDELAAFAALGGAPGDKGLGLSEEEFLDSKARIVSLHTHQRGAASASVEVEIASSKGTYVATFEVAPGNQGPVIESHDFIKP